MRTDNLQEELWAKVFIGGYKLHYCPRRLAGPLLAELQERRRTDHPEADDGSEGTIEPIKEGFIDLPGMVMLDRPLEKIKIDTFELEMPSQDFIHFVRELALVKERTFADGQRYYKIHGWLSCVVFTPEQRKLVLDAMETMIPAVEKRAEEADKEFSRRMREINKDGPRVVSHRDKESPHVRRVPVPPKDNN